MSGFVSAAECEPEDGNVTHGYVEGPRPLFVSYHRPDRQRSRTGFVICPPLGWEAIQSYRSLRILAERLAQAGIPSLRLNYDGTGESPGSDQDPGRVAAWIASIRHAGEALARVEGVESVGLIGLRIGATLAACAAESLGLSRLVLWEPFASGAQYTREMEILAAAAISREKETASAAPPGPGLEAAGTLLTHETISSLNALDIAQMLPRGKPDILIVTRDDRPSPSSTRLQKHLMENGCSVTIERLPGFREMMTYPENSQPPLAAIDRICSWAGQQGPQSDEGALAPAGPLALAESAVTGAVRRRPVRFGPRSRIFGVVTEPAGSPPQGPRPALLLLTGGLVPRTAVNRMYKDLARIMADRGHAVLRMDISGIGESFVPVGGAIESPHPPWLLEDVTCAARRLLSDARADKLWAVGLCSGAYAAFHLAEKEPRVEGTILINPADLLQVLGASEPNQAQQIQDAIRYRQSLASWAGWAKLLKGQIHIAGALAFVRGRVRVSFISLRDRLSTRLFRRPAGLAGDIHSLLDRGTKLSIVFAEGDVGQKVLQDQIGRQASLLLERGCTFAVFPGTDHTFNQLSARQSLLEWIVAEMNARQTKANH